VRIKPRPTSAIQEEHGRLRSHPQPHRAVGQERVTDLLRWRRIPGGFTYIRRYGLVALLERIFPRVRKWRTYRDWVRLYDTITDRDRQAIRAALGRLADPPLISVLLVVRRVEPQHLRAAIESVAIQLYPGWELCIAADPSGPLAVRDLVESYRARDARIKVCYGSPEDDVSLLGNRALAVAEGRFVALLEADGMLPEHALYVVVSALAEEPELDLIFSDQDKIDKDGNRFDPCFKPDWNPDLMLSQNMFDNLGVYRRTLLHEIGGFRAGYDTSRNYDLVLRASSRTRPERIRHIPRVLYHQRASPGTARTDASADHVAEEARRSVAHYLAECGVPAVVSAAAGSRFHRVHYDLPQPAPPVSIIVPTRDRIELLRRCIDGLLHNTDYDKLEVVIVDNDSIEPESHAYFASIAEDGRVRVIRYPGTYNYSAINNFAIAEARYPVITLLNNDMEVIHRDWLREMVSHAIRPEVGAVGAKLYYPDGSIQHAGIIAGLGGAAGHAFRYFGRHEPGHCNRLLLTQNFLAVTAACMVFRRAVLEEIGGLDPANLPVTFNDLDLCLRMRDKGYRVVWTPHAELYHWESVSRGPDLAPETIERFRSERKYLNERWSALLANDPCYNPNLTLQREDFSLAFPPRVESPWRLGAR
jgi:O-antigen biosynthesis protein